MAIEKIKILGAVLELPAKQHCQFSPFGPIFEVNGLDWQCYLAGSSKRAPRNLIFSIAMGAEYLFYVKFIATRAPTFFGYIISVLTNVQGFDFYEVKKNDITFQKEKGNTFTLLIIFIVKSLQKEQNSTNLLL